jgi:curved DNA-binding protein CbpA
MAARVMDAYKDYYRLLGVRPGQSSREIRKAYIILVKQYHPDSSFAAQRPDEHRAKELNEAYDVLSDPAQRARYDDLRRQLHGAAAPAPKPAAPAPQDPQVKALAAELAALSPALAAQFQAEVAASGNPASAAVIARRVEAAYLARYFGSEPAARKFARLLLLSGEREAAKELNQLVKAGASAGAVEQAIAGLRAKYRLDRPDYRRHRHRGVELAIGFAGAVQFYMVPKGERLAK